MPNGVAFCHHVALAILNVSDATAVVSVVIHVTRFVLRAINRAILVMTSARLVRNVTDLVSVVISVRNVMTIVTTVRIVTLVKIVILVNLHLATLQLK